MNSRRALRLALGMAVLTITSAAAATNVTSDAAGTDSTDTLLNYPLLGGPDSHEIARLLLEEQLRFHYDGLGSLHQSHSSRRHGHGTTIGQNGQGDCGANNVTISTLDSGHNGHRGKNRSRPLPPSTTSCPPPNPAGGGGGVGSNVPPGGNGDPTDSAGSSDWSGNDLSGNFWLSDTFVTNDAPVTGVPEPGTLALLALGLGSLWLGKRRSERR